ncbi:hypothetical protein AABM27_03510 [Heyndrickxia faecalis]|jgi:hypothetical protein|uniref:hypothetical protein n=1 Tax=Heyndrickxia TaxID=2837504 RepID=UPI002F39A3FF
MLAFINHQVSLRLEMAARKALNVNSRGALYGVVDADYIDQVGNAFTVLVAALAPYYKDASSEVQTRIETFLEKYSFLDDQDISKNEYSEGVEKAATELRELLGKL